MNPNNQGGYPGGPGYPAYPPQGAGYPPAAGAQSGFPQQQPGGYPPQQPGGYPAPQYGGFPAPQSGGYPPQGSGGYPAPQSGGYPPQGSGGYPPQQSGGYPVPQSGGFPPQQLGGNQAFSPNKHFIPGGLSPGRLINVTLTPGPSKFHINLRHSEGGDIALHFNPRLPERVVVRNTMVNGGWQGEERQQPSFPFAAGQQCNIMILCEQSQFKVAVNGQHFIEFRIRTGGLQLIQWVEVEGDFTLGSLNVQ